MADAADGFAKEIVPPVSGSSTRVQRLGCHIGCQDGGGKWWSRLTQKGVVLKSQPPTYRKFMYS